MGRVAHDRELRTVSGFAGLCARDGPVEPAVEDQNTEPVTEPRGHGRPGRIPFAQLRLTLGPSRRSESLSREIGKRRQSVGKRLRLDDAGEFVINRDVWRPVGALVGFEIHEPPR